MLPFVAIGGLLVVRKIRRFSLVIGFLLSATITIAGFTLLKGGELLATMESTVIYSPLLFFAFVMLTEPLTTPPSKKLQIIYGVLTGVLFSPQLRVGGFYTTPETALLIGNVFSYFVSPKEKLILKLKEKIQLAPDIFDFVFEKDQSFFFTPGQYLEWTLPHKDTDSRGNRRYFTLASSPTEEDVRIGVKFYENSSSFKKSLSTLTSEHPITAGQLSGDFVIDSNPNKKYVFLAGGIGITPFRSIIKNLLDTNSKRDIVLIYSAKTADQFVYQDIFTAAQEKLGIKTIYDLTHSESAPPNWTGKLGRLTGEMIIANVPDYKQRVFYLSGPHSMVTGFEETLKTIGVSGQKIKTDYFPGFV
jgi:ferredoxin-NADP reductase